MAQEPLVPAITGPTACGKTELVLSLTEELPLEVVECDSRKVFRGLDIGAAKPDAEMRKRLRFHLLDLVEPDGSFTVFDFVSLAIRAVRDILGRGNIPVLEGGSGLYLTALVQGFRFERAPAIPELRESLADRWAKDGYDTFAKTALALFPEARRETEVRNPRRMLRFLEDRIAALPPDELPQLLAALELSGVEEAVCRVRREWERRRQAPAPETGFRITGFVLEVGRDALQERIRRRTSEMFARGLVAEVERLLNAGVPADSQALQGIGYHEVIESLLGHISLEEAESQVAIHTRQLAKRQVTWFRHQLPGFTRMPFTTRRERENARAALLGKLTLLHKKNSGLLQQ